MTDPTTDLAERDSAVNPLTLAVEQFDAEQQEVIAKFVGLSSKDDPALLPFLGVAAHLGLSPILGEIWLIKGRREVNNTWEDFYRPAVGRDGFLKKAREHPNFKSVRSNVVCANDTFEWEDDGDEINMLHRAASLPKGIDPKQASRYRGPVIGAWAKLRYKDDTPPFFYYAMLHEHGKTKESTKDGEARTEWQGSWGYTSTMIQKSAQSYVLRIGLGISGAVPVDELVGGNLPGSQTGGGDSPVKLDADPDADNDEIVNGLEGVDDAVKSVLRAALHEVNELMPFSWAPAKVAVVLGGADQQTAEGVLADIEAEITRIRDNHEADAVREEAEKVKDAVEVVAAEDTEPGMRVELNLDENGPEQYVLSAVLAREGMIVLCSIVEGKEAEIHELEPKAEVEVVGREDQPEEKKGKGKKK